MASDPTLLQMQLRRNNEELQEALKGLDSWESDIKKRDELIKKQKPILKKTLPPVRGRSRDPHKITKKSKQAFPDEVKPKRIKSYDYNAWNKFDVEAACKEETSSEEEAEDSEEQDDNYDDEARKQTAVLEKERGNQLYKEGKYKAAVERYTEAINLDPTSAVLPANRAMALIKLERYGAAEVDCSLAIDLDKTYVKAWMRRGVARIKQNKLISAKNDLQEVLKLEPSNKQAKLELQKLEKVKSEEERPLDKRRVYPVKRPPHLRSKKPLVRVPIEEISSCSNEEKQELLEHKERTTQPLEELLVQKNTTVPAVPKNSIQFQRDWKLLCTDNNKLVAYFKSIPTSEYSQVLRQSLESDIFSDIIRILENEYIKNGKSCLEELKQISEVQRFPVAIMFLSMQDKESLKRIFKSLHDFCEDINVVHNLAKKYSVTLIV